MTIKKRPLRAIITSLKDVHSRRPLMPVLHFANFNKVNPFHRKTQKA